MELTTSRFQSCHAGAMLLVDAALLLMLLCSLMRRVPVGCGSIEEVILRDVPRTFPEHPLFNTPAGQQKLFRVLKAYAAADPEVRLI
jgi:hypothetical protein